jgi:hypothetical protein
MSSILYKNGESIKVPYNRLKAHLDTGWSTSKDDAPKSEEAPKKTRKSKKVSVKND